MRPASAKRSTHRNTNRAAVRLVAALALGGLLVSAPALPAAPVGGEPTPQAPGLPQARELFAADRFEEARQALAAVLESSPDDDVANLLMGRTLLVLGELDAADRHLLRAAATPASDERFMVPHTQVDEALAIAPGYSGARIARAQARAFQEDLDGALQDLRAVQESPRPQPAARVLTGELLLAGDDMESAFDEFAAVGDGDGDTPAAENAAMYVGTMAPSPEETEARIVRGMGRVPARPQAYFWLAVVRRSAGDDVAARQLLEVALSVDELHAPSWVALRRLPDPPADLEQAVGPAIPGLEYRMSSLRRALEAGAIERVTLAAEEILARRPRHVPAHLLRAEAARRQSQPLLMLEALGDLAQVVPWLVSARAERAVLARDLGALDLAETEARQAVRLLPRDGSLRFLLATVLMAQGKAEAAAEAAEAALERDYDLAQVHVLLGDAYQELQRLPESVAALTRAVEMDAAVAEQIAGFALGAMTAAGSDELVGLLQGALAEKPDGPNTMYALASLYLRRGDAEGAAELLERLLELVPGRSEFHYNLALAYRRLGREAEAEQQTQRFEQLKTEEDRLFAQANETYRRRAEAVQALAAGAPERAVELLRQVIDAPGSQPDDRALLGSAQMAAGQSRAAAESYRAALEVTPFDTGALCGAIAAARDLGDEARMAELQARVRTLGATCPSAS